MISQVSEDVARTTRSAPDSPLRYSNPANIDNKGEHQMNPWLRVLLAHGLTILANSAMAGPCPDITGTWDFSLNCVAYDTGTGTPHAGTRAISGVVAFQEGCVFHGTLGGYSWVGALHGDQNRSVESDYGGAKTTGGLDGMRGGVFQGMSLTYTYADFSLPGGGPQTACTGHGTRR
jgi:hypothetical protein